MHLFEAVLLILLLGAASVGYRMIKKALAEARSSSLDGIYSATVHLPNGSIYEGELTAARIVIDGAVIPLSGFEQTSLRLAANGSSYPVSLLGISSEPEVGNGISGEFAMHVKNTGNRYRIEIGRFKELSWHRVDDDTPSQSESD